MTKIEESILKLDAKTDAATGAAYPVGSPLASFPDDRNGNA